MAVDRNQFAVVDELAEAASRNDPTEEFVGLGAHEVVCCHPHGTDRGRSPEAQWSDEN
ncbi:hypothetical protein D3C80_1732150 [compost metagenome]